MIFFIQGCHPLIDYQNKWKLFGFIFPFFPLRVVAIKMILPGQDRLGEEGGEQAGSGVYVLLAQVEGTH